MFANRGQHVRTRRKIERCTRVEVNDDDGNHHEISRFSIYPSRPILLQRTTHAYFGIFQSGTRLRGSDTTKRIASGWLLYKGRGLASSQSQPCMRKFKGRLDVWIPRFDLMQNRSRKPYLHRVNSRVFYWNLYWANRLTFLVMALHNELKYRSTEFRQRIGGFFGPNKETFSGKPLHTVKAW